MADKPNLLFMISHDLGQHLHCYGAKTVRSDHLDELAANGVRFENVFSAAPQCSPARASIATGRYPHNNGVMGLAHDPFSWTLPERETHVASLLKDNGYQTALIGMQHVIDNPATIGFEKHIPGANSTEAAPNAEEWLENYARNTDDRPFYLEIGFEEVHRPYGLNKPDAMLGMELPRWLPSYEGSDEEIAAMQGDIFALDHAVGRILNKLDELNLRANTIVIFTADHGLDFPRAKGTLYDPGIEVPLIMHHPNSGFSGGKVISNMISHIDLLPTLLECLEIEILENVQGESFLFEITGEENYETRSEIYAEKTYHTTYDPIRCVRTEDYKLIMHFNTYDTVDVPIDAKASPVYHVMLDELVKPHNYCELFDLNKDPLEKNNVAEDPAYEQVLSRMLEHLQRWMEDTEDPLLNGPVPSPQYRRSIEILSGERELR
ncbi:MAG TPA: sulfatase [Bacillales bacterium]|nr:sulfatase [Bacillales bacterium]